MTVQVLTRDASLRITGQLTGWSTLTCTRTLNAAGTWSLTFAATPAAAGLTGPGAGIVIVRDGVVFASGPVESPGFSRSASDESPGTLKLDGTTDLVCLADRVIYPDPTAPVTAQTAAAQYVRSGAAGAVIEDLVNVNAGPGARAERQVAGLVVPSGSTDGSPVTTNARYAVLTDELRNLALVGGGLVFDVAQQLSATGLGQVLAFTVGPHRDLSALARFSFELGNLRAASFGPQAPTVTDAIVAGQGAGTQRNITEYRDGNAEALWGRRVELFVDQRDTADPAQLAQSGQQALAGGAEQVQLASTTVDGPTLRFGADDTPDGVVGYRLGDLVSVSPFPGTAVTDLVRQVTLTVTRDAGEQVTALVGSPDSTTDTAAQQRIRALEQRISHLERNT